MVTPHPFAKVKVDPTPRAQEGLCRPGNEIGGRPGGRPPIGYFKRLRRQAWLLDGSRAPGGDQNLYWISIP